MSENALLGFAGLGAGLLIGFWLIRILPSLLTQPPSMFQPMQDFRLDARVLWFTLFVAGCTIALFGLVPALREHREIAEAK